MKSREDIYWQRCWVVGLILTVIIFGPFVTTNAQTVKTKIVAIGTHSTFEQGLFKPTKILQDLHITSEEIQRKLEPGIRISVVGPSSARILVIASFPELSLPPTRSSIHVSGASFVRNIDLILPPSP